MVISSYRNIPIDCVNKLVKTHNNIFSKYPRNSEGQRFQNHVSGFHMERIIIDINLYWNQDLPENDNCPWT